MEIQELAKKLAVQNKMIRAEKYDMVFREFDNMIEIIGYVEDPNYSMEDFRGREMLFPKRWLTLGVLPAETTIKL